MKYTPHGIAFTGRMHSGKDTAADFLLRLYGTRHLATGATQGLKCKRMAFADPLKDICINGFGLTHEQVYTSNGKDMYLPDYEQTVRQFLQNVGQAMRDGVHKDIWTILMKKKLQACADSGTFFIVTDVRYPNEAKMIHDFSGLVVRVDRGIQVPDTHPSEQPIPDELVDETVLNNGDTADYEQKLTDLFARALNLSAFYTLS